METAAYLIAIILGLLFGSFTNVIIYRLPAQESIVFPPSNCPACNERLKVRDLVPVFSWLFLKRRCRYCGAMISLRYPTVEILTALLFTCVYLRFGWSAQTLAGCVFSVILLVAAFIDLDHGIIPDRLTWPGMVIGLVLSFWTMGFLPALYGCLAFGGMMFLIAVISNGGMGGGDVKLAGVIGAFTGLAGSAITILLASLSGALFGLGLMALRKGGRKTPVKFGPFLAVSAWLAYLFADMISRWYLGQFF